MSRRCFSKNISLVLSATLAACANTVESGVGSGYGGSSTTETQTSVTESSAVNSSSVGSASTGVGGSDGSGISSSGTGGTAFECAHKEDCAPDADCRRYSCTTDGTCFYGIPSVGDYPACGPHECMTVSDCGSSSYYSTDCVDGLCKVVP